LHNLELSYDSEEDDNLHRFNATKFITLSPSLVNITLNIWNDKETDVPLEGGVQSPSTGKARSEQHGSELRQDGRLLNVCSKLEEVKLSEVYSSEDP
ncbi:hypothetical protein BGX26_006108, partial [Mortierella sp. AD094]